MKKMKNNIGLLFVIAIVLLFSTQSCATRKICNRKFPPKTDSVYIEKEVIKEVYRDTTIYVELPPLEIEKFVPIKDTLKLKGNFSEAKAWVVDSVLVGNLKEGTQPVKIEYKIKEVEKIVTKETIVEKVVTEKYIPKIYQISLYFMIFIILIIIFLVARKLKFF
jgi:hypothetical protein